MVRRKDARSDGYTEMKLLVAAIYTNYTTSIVDDTGIEQNDGFIGGPKGNKLILKFERVAV